jgi:hypothetical protein
MFTSKRKLLDKEIHPGFALIQVESYQNGTISQHYRR